MKHLFGLIFLFTFAPSWSQTKAILGKTSYPFLCQLPADSILKNKPALLIFLHGRSLSGTDLNRVRRYGILTEVEKGRNIPAIVVAPQLKPGESWNPDKVLEILNWVHKEYTIDTNRV
jgi:predicted peptidase